MNEAQQIEFEKQVELGHAAKAVLVFLDAFLLEQRARIMTQLENGLDYETDILIADLRALSRLEKSLKKCVRQGEYAREELENGDNDKD